MTGKTLTVIATTIMIGASAMPGFTWDRLTPQRGDRFVEIDTDSDGSITPKEFAAFHQQRMNVGASKQFSGVGADNMALNGNQKGTGSQLAGNRRSLSADCPRDGSRKMALNADNGQQGMPGGQRMQPANRQGHMKNTLFVRADLDGNQQVTEDEFTKAASQMFLRMDRNKDMIITTDEFPARAMR